MLQNPATMHIYFCNISINRFSLRLSNKVIYLHLGDRDRTHEKCKEVAKPDHFLGPIQEMENSLHERADGTLEVLLNEFEDVVQG